MWCESSKRELLHNCTFWYSKSSLRITLRGFKEPFLFKGDETEQWTWADGQKNKPCVRMKAWETERKSPVVACDLLALYSLRMSKVQYLIEQDCHTIMGYVNCFWNLMAMSPYNGIKHVLQRHSPWSILRLNAFQGHNGAGLPLPSASHCWALKEQSTQNVHFCCYCYKEYL